MTIIVTKPGIIIDVVGSYFYDKKIMTENGLFILGGPETQLHDILWAVHDGKNRGRSEGEENFGEFLVTVGGQGPSDARFSCTCTRVGVMHWDLTEPERGVRLLNASDCTAGYTLLNPSDRSMAVN